MIDGPAKGKSQFIRLPPFQSLFCLTFEVKLQGDTADLRLGWVDFDLGCSPVLPSCPASSAWFPPAQAYSGRQWNNKNKLNRTKSQTGWVTLY